MQFEFKILDDKIRVYQKADDIKILMDGEYMHMSGMVFGSAGQENEEKKYLAEIIEENGSIIGYAANIFGECDSEKVTLEGYTERLRFGDKVLRVHIPSDGAFTKELCDASYEQAIEVVKQCYPEFDYKAICCHSWMMEKRLRQIMRRDTNITRFADRYYVFPRKSSGDDVFTFLYHMHTRVSAEILPEKNSMQKAVKDYLREGKHIYEKGGCFFCNQ